MTKGVVHPFFVAGTHILARLADRVINSLTGAAVLPFEY